MKIHELLDRDPRTGRLANNGQARLTDERQEQALAELRAELECFVCDGQFGQAMQRILDRYLAGLGAPRQESAWVSGFFGSGKSHLIKMLTHLWVNTKFADGATARSLVPGGLPADIDAALREIDVQAKRSGRPAVAAAGTLLGGNERVRETIAAVLLRSTGWHPQVAPARFCFWLREQGKLDAVRHGVEASGKDWLKELNHLYVSPVIARCVLEHVPRLAADESAVKQLLKAQFTQPSVDLTTPEFVELARQALSPDDALPLTLLVLDEVQQYINQSSDRAGAFVETAEALQTQFQSRVMLVGAGQSALSAGTTALFWLRDRFRITVELSDADVEAVTRKVLLRKKPTAMPDIERILDAHSGEVSRHLLGSQIGQRAEDRALGVVDYPLLPVRRRFWEACFQSADPSGSQGQLRSQLRIVHDSLHDVATRDLGTVIPAADLFNALAGSFVAAGTLLGEVHTRILKLDDGTPAGRLRRDLCGLIFLIARLPADTGRDLGMRASAQVLGDLTVEDITLDSGVHRRIVEDLLEAMIAEGVLMKVDAEYRLQTTEGAEWDREFRQRQVALRQVPQEMAPKRESLFGAAIQQALGDIRLMHGDSKVRRKLELHLGNEPPSAGEDCVWVWLRDGWSIAEKEAIAEARRRGQDDAVLHVHLPKKNAQELETALIEVEAARQVLDHYGTPSGAAAVEARASMESRKRGAESRRDEILRDLIAAARVFQGGGSEIFGDSLAIKLESGAKSSLTRLYPRFAEADHRAWEAAIKRARDGSDEPLKVVGWDGATADHPVAKEILARIGAGIRGSELQRSLTGAPLGWPQDAVDAVLIALHRGGHVRAIRNGAAVAPSGLDQAAVKASEFRLEKVRLTVQERMVLRGLFGEADVTVKSGDEESRAADFFGALDRLAAAAGGAAPLPAPPSTNALDDIRRMAGAEQLAALLQAKDVLAKDMAAWKQRAERAKLRVPAWELAVALQQQAEGLAVGAEAGAELDAIRQQRSLLDDVDPLAPLLKRLAADLRDELKRARALMEQVVLEGDAMLEADASWAKLSPTDREAVRSEAGLGMPAAPAVGTDGDLCRSLQARSLAGWQELADALPGRSSRAMRLAAERLAKASGAAAPTRVALRRGTLSDEGAVRAWIDETSSKLLDAARKGPVVVE